MPMTLNEAEACVTDFTLRCKVAYNAPSGADAVLESSTRESARTSFTVKLDTLKLLLLCFLFCGSAYATSYAPLKFSQEPTAAQVLEHNGLASADEETLLDYLEAHWDAVGYWSPELTDSEQERISSEFFRRVELRGRDADAYLTKARAQLEVDRLEDPRRILDATIRELGRIGTKKSLVPLLNRPRFEEREWVRWKSLASVQEILPRVDPTQLEREIMIHISADLVAPLLRDLNADVANIWAWTLWERQKDVLSAAFRSNVRLRTRIWLAKAFAASHPQVAAEVFREGLQSQDAAIRTASEMIIRSGIGGSLPYNTSSEQLAKSFLSREWHTNTPLWDTLPLPLDRPLLRKLVGGRTDLIWLSSNARIARSEDDVWPLIRESLTNGNFYSRVGEFFPMEYGLSDRDGVLHSRIQIFHSTPMIASHGGLWAINGHNRIAEFQADGSKLWECPVNDDEYREIVPISGGRVVLLGHNSIESRNRRGDLLWKNSLHSLNDPRNFVPIEDDRFLVSCGTTVGWLTRDGKYEPVLTGFKSAGWIRYHPTEPWIILEGSDSSVVVYDPKTKKKMGRVDLDDGWGEGKSRFPFPRTYFPE